MKPNVHQIQVFGSRTGLIHVNEVVNRQHWHLRWEGATPTCMAKRSYNPGSDVFTYEALVPFADKRYDHGSSMRFDELPSHGFRTEFDEEGTNWGFLTLPQHRFEALELIRRLFPETDMEWGAYGNLYFLGPAKVPDGAKQREATLSERCKWCDRRMDDHGHDLRRDGHIHWM